MQIGNPIVDFIEIPVSDTVVAEAEYVRVFKPLGARRVGRKADATTFQWGALAFCLRLDPQKAGGQTSLSFCLSDRTAVSNAYSLAQSAGWKIESPPSERYFPRGCFGFSMEDRDGNTLNLYSKWHTLPDLPNALRVRVPGHGGVELGGYLYTPGQLTGAALIVLHGHTGCAADLDAPAKRYATQGHTVLTLSLRGHVGTEAEDDQGLYETDDIVRAVDWLARHEGIDQNRIGLIGQSHGGQVALLANARGAKVAAVAAWSAPSDMQTVAEAIPTLAMYWEDLPEPERLHERSPIRLAERMRAPVLLIHGDADKDIPITESISLHKALLKFGRQSRLSVYPGEGHFFSEEGRRKAEAELDAFMAQHLLDIV